MKPPPGKSFPVLLMYNRTLQRGNGRTKCHSMGALALLISVVMTNSSSAFIVKGPPLPLFGNGRTPFLSSVPIFVHDNYKPTTPEIATALPTTMPQEPVEATLATTLPPSPDTAPSEAESVSVRSSLPVSTSTSSNDVVTPISTPRTAPVAFESDVPRFYRKPPDGEEPTGITFWNDNVSSAEINANTYPKGVESAAAITPAMTPLKPAQSNASRNEYNPYVAYNNPRMPAHPSYPSSEPWTHRVPTMLQSSSDSIKWYIIGAVTLLLIALVCVFILGLRSIEARKNRKLKEFVFQSGLGYPGSDQNGPTSYMDIRPCSPVAKQWKTRGSSFGSTSHLQIPSGRSTPSGTLKKSVKLMEDATGRQRSGSGAANILAKWKSLGKSSSRKGLQHTASAEGMHQPSMYSPHGFGYMSRRPAPPRACGDCPQRQQYCACQDGCPKPCDCDGGGGGGGDPDCCHADPDGGYQATVHFNPLHAMCVPQNVCSNHASQESVFVQDDCHDCGAHVHPPAVQCVAPPPHGHCQPLCAFAEPSCHPGHGDCAHQHGRGARSCALSSHCGSLCFSEHATDAASRGATMQRPNNARHWRTLPGTQNESAEHLLSMLAQAHHLAKGMSLERRVPQSDSCPGTHHSEASTTSTLARRTEFDESSGYIGSSPCARSPYSLKANKTTSGSNLALQMSSVPMPEQVAARLKETEQQQRQQQHQHHCNCKEQPSKPALPYSRQQQQQQQQKQQHRRRSPEPAQAAEEHSGRRKQRPRTLQQRNDESGRCSRLSLHNSQADIDKSQSTPSLTTSQDSKPSDTVKRTGRKVRAPVPNVSIQAPGVEMNAAGGRGARQSAPAKPARQLQHIEPASANIMLRTEGANNRPTEPPKQRIVQNLPPWRRESLGCLTEKSSSASETHAAVPERLPTQQPLKSSSFWNVPNYGSNLTRPQATVISNYPYNGHPGNPSSLKCTDAMHLGSAGPTALPRTRPESAVSQDDGMTIANPYSQLSPDLLPPPHLSDLYGLASGQFNASSASYGSHALPELLQPRNGLPRGATGTGENSGVDAAAATAGNAANKTDLSRQNTNSSTEEQKGNFYYLREGDHVVHPGAEQQSHLKAPTMHQVQSQYRRGITGPGLRQVSQLSGDSFETCQTTTL